VALNKEVFKTRALTAVVFAMVMLGGLLWNMWSFIILLTLIHFGAWFEYIKLMKKISSEKFILYSLLGLAYITLPVILLFKLSFFWKGFEYTNYWPSSNERVYVSFFPCLIIFSIWVNDTMQYIVGSLIGKTPFSKISPKKTWEGTIGGAILCVIVIGITYTLIYKTKTIVGFNTPIPFIHYFAIAAICAVFGTLGDLLESKIKRLAGVKDSGSFMPGHGGFLDRFDSLLVAAPFVWLYVQVFVV
jgi:phosphatidate cytidylyltransferase